MSLSRSERARLGRLQRIVDEAERRGPTRLSEEDLELLPRLQRHASTLLVRLEAQRSSIGLERELRRLVARGHALLARDAEAEAGAWPSWPRRALGFLLATNALMVGTYTAIAGHWGQAGAISSILWCHGVIELQMIVLAGAAGLVLVRAIVAPGPWDRRERLASETRVAWRLFAPVAPLLVVSGLIEGYVSPHAPFGVRVATAVGTGVALVLWVGLGGRGTAEADAGPRLEPSGDEPRRAFGR